MTRLRGIAASAAGVLATAGAALAADPHAAEEKISIFTGNLGNAIWTLLIFGLVVVVLGKYAWKPILTGLQRREQFIRESLESAKRDREAAEARLREFEERMRAAREQAAAIVEEGRRDAEVVRKQIEEEARQSGDALIERAKREIGVARDTALRDLYDASADLAMNMAGSVLKRQLNDEDHGRLVSDALAELQTKGPVNRG